jgi:hypothetical protein
MKPVEIIEALMTPTANHVQIIEQAWDDDNEHFWIGVSLGTSPEFNYGLKDVPALPDDDLEAGNLTFVEFYQLALDLSQGKLLGEKARAAVENAAMRADSKEWNLWYRRILLKSLGKHIPLDLIKRELIRLTAE